MRRTWILVSLFSILFLGFFFFLGMVAYFFAGDEESFTFGKGVGVVAVEGPIFDVKNILEDIREFEMNSDVTAVILRVDSPGGSVASSQEIYEAVGLLKQKKPVIASFGAVAASGGYYVACNASKIFANAGTTTGSIGVRLDHVVIGDLMKWAKVSKETLTSGKYKDLISIDKPISPEAREILDKLIKDIHVQFKKAVAEGRKLDIGKVDELADGRVFTGEEAKALGLVDELGGFIVATKEAARLGGISGEPRLIYPKKKGAFVDRLISEASSSISENLNGFTGSMWLPVLMLQTST